MVLICNTGDVTSREEALELLEGTSGMMYGSTLSGVKHLKMALHKNCDGCSSNN